MMTSLTTMRRRRAGDVAELERHAFVRIVLALQLGPRLPVANQILDEVHDTGSRKRRERDRPSPVLERLAGFRVQREEEEARRGDVDHAAAVDLVIRDAFAVGGAHRVLRSVGLRLDEVPEQLAARRIDRHDVTPRPGDAQELAADVARRGARGHRTDDVLRAEAPRLLERLEVRRCDLVERGIARAPGVAALVAPLAVGGSACRTPICAEGMARYAAPSRPSARTPPTTASECLFILVSLRNDVGDH